MHHVGSMFNHTTIVMYIHNIYNIIYIDRAYICIYLPKTRVFGVLNQLSDSELGQHLASRLSKCLSQRCQHQGTGSRSWNWQKQGYPTPKGYGITQICPIELCFFSLLNCNTQIGTPTRAYAYHFSHAKLPTRGLPSKKYWIWRNTV